MRSVSRSIDRLAVTFDDDTLVANAGLIVPATLMVRLGLEALVNSTVRLAGRVGGARPGRHHRRIEAAFTELAQTGVPWKRRDLIPPPSPTGATMRQCNRAPDGLQL